MPTQNGYALIEISSGSEIMSWVWDTYGHLPPRPNVLNIPNGDHVHCPELDISYSGYKLTKKYTSDDPPDPGLEQPKLVAAAFNVTISGGDIQSIGGAFNLIGALYIDVGQYMLLLLQPEPDDYYVAQIIDGGGMSIKVSERGTDYMTVECRDAAGVMSDTAQFGIQVFRF